MPSGAAVIRRPGKRSTSWAIKWCDVDGRQCWETLGREPDWNEAKAQRELGKRLQAVERDRWRKPERVDLSAFADRFEADYLPGRNLKPSTLIDYRLTLRVHLRPFLGHLDSPRSSLPTSTRTSRPRRGSCRPRRSATTSVCCA